MATFTVTTTADVVDANDGVISLREAVTLANTAAGADTITFDASVFTGDAASLIRLKLGEIVITDAVKIDGSTGTGVSITGDKNDDDVTLAGTDITDVKASFGGTAGAADDLLDDNSRIFNITSSIAETTLDGLTLTGGRTTADNAAGGAVSSLADLTIIDSTVSGNSTAGSGAAGGGIFGVNTVTLTNSTVGGNSTAGSDADGGGIWGLTVTLTNSTVSGNSTAGGIADGGGIFGNTVTLTNSTVSGNSTAGSFSEGGGIFGFTSVTLTNSIVLGNDSAQTALEETSRTVIANGLNIVGTGNDTNGSDGVINADPTNVFAQTVDIGGGVLAGVLANNGGPVQTIALKADATNPALDASNTSAPPLDANGNARFDQPGVDNLNGSAADLGAAEAGEFPSLVVTTNLDVVDAFDGMTSLREAIAYANGKAGADTITFDATVFTGEAASLIRLTNGELTISDSVVIDGKTGTGVTITGDANGDDIKLAGTDITDVAASSSANVLSDNSRLFVQPAKFQNGAFVFDTFTLKGLTLTGGSAQGFNSGGAIRSNLHYVVIEDSEISGNNAGFSGGALALDYLTISDSTLSGNVSGDYGGAITVSSDLIMTSTTVANNTAGSFAGGIFVQGLSTPTVTITNSTITGNKVAGDSGGIYSNYDQTTLVNSIVLGNDAAGVGPDEIGGLFKVAGLNIVGSGSDTDASDGMINANPATVFAQTVDIGGGVLAGVLADNGGPVQTIALKLDATNPALDASDNLAPTTDARGNTRVDHTGVGNDGADFADLGAFEAINTGPAATAISVGTIETNTRIIALAPFVSDPDGDTLRAILINGLAITAGGAAVTLASGATVSLAADGLTLTYDPNGAFDALPGPGSGAAVTTALEVLQYTVADSFGAQASASIRVTLAGVDSEDTLFGGPGADTLFGNSGSDLIFGGDGGDRILGGEGEDTLLGQAGDDVILGGNGADKIGGGGGADRLFGDAGDDVIGGGADNDTIYGGAGADTLFGDDGDDLILGGDDGDRISGGLGADRLFGEAGNDIMSGGDGADTIYGDDGLDYLRGDAGDDILYGGLGNDIMNGDGGADTLLGNDGQDTLIGGADNDLLVGGAGGDAFVWTGVADGTDTVLDYNAAEGDQIDVMIPALFELSQFGTSTRVLDGSGNIAFIVTNTLPGDILLI